MDSGEKLQLLGYIDDSDDSLGATAESVLN